MIDQDKLINFKEKYQNNPVVFIEDFYPEVKLYEYQKEMLETMFRKDITYSYINYRINQKRWLVNMKLELMKTLEMNFQVWSPKGIDVYEKGVLVKTIKHNK